MRPDSCEIPTPTFVIDAGEILLSRAKGLGDEIADRVRHALGVEPSAEPSPDEARPLRVLCVDDVPDAADALAAVVELLGCEVKVCYDGAAALRAAQDFRPDVCVLDLSMPGLDGVQLAARIRGGARSRPLFLVAATGLGGFQERGMTAIAGFHFHLVKPIDLETIRRTIDDIRSRLQRSAGGGC